LHTTTNSPISDNVAWTRGFEVPSVCWAETKSRMERAGALIVPRQCALVRSQSFVAERAREIEDFIRECDLVRPASENAEGIYDVIDMLLTRPYRARH